MSKHAPRGPVKAKGDDPTQQIHPTHREPGKFGPRCTATSKTTGKPCQSPAIQGGFVCRMHGGSAPQVKASAKERLMALQPLAIQTMHTLMQREEYPTVQLGAARDVLDRTEGKAKETIDLSVKQDPTNWSDEELRAKVASLSALLNSQNP